MMSDLISREAAIDEGMSYINGDCFCDKEDFAKYIEFIEQMPPAEPKRISGKWIDRGERGDWEWQADGRGKHWHEWECNICHHYFDERTFFCPHCGADMRGEQYG